MILIISLIGVVGAVHAQEKKPSLKDLLYSGKLKKDSTGVIRSTDDLSQKMDTGTKKESQPVNTPNAQQEKNAVPASAAVTPSIAPGGADTTTKVDTAAGVAVQANTIPPKSNTKLLKEYTDSVVNSLRDEALKSKQIKKGTYYLMLDYEIETDGQVTFTNVISTPENSFLQAQVKQILDSTPLRLIPVTDSNNQPKKVKRKQQISITKD
ncbi:MAG TPA: hypothetical protein VFP87_16095 [Chitinophagaceae bacterium]|nr:hypothetical protein [Chitinophagaceae bacterium]